MLQVSCPRNGNGVIDFHFFPLPSDTFIKVGSYPGFSSLFIDHSEADWFKTQAAHGVLLGASTLSLQSSWGASQKAI